MGEIGGRSVAFLGGRRATGDIHGQRQNFDLKLPGRWGGSSAGACLPPMTGYWHITILVWRLAEIDDPLPKGGVSPKGNTIICLGSDGLYEFLGSTVRGAD